jgi:hypothetical protein
LAPTSNADGHTWARTCSKVRYQVPAAAEWISQFCGCKPTAYEATALVLYSTFCPGVVVAVVVAVAVAARALLAGKLGLATLLVGVSEVAAGAATRVREPVAATEEGLAVPDVRPVPEGYAVPEGWTVPEGGWEREGCAVPQPANVAQSNAATPTSEASEANEEDRRVEGHTAPRA